MTKYPFTAAVIVYNTTVMRYNMTVMNQIAAVIGNIKAVIGYIKAVICNLFVSNQNCTPTRHCGKKCYLISFILILPYMNRMVLVF